MFYNREEHHNDNETGLMQGRGIEIENYKCFPLYVMHALSISLFDIYTYHQYIHIDLVLHMYHVPYNLLDTTVVRSPDPTTHCHTCRCHAHRHHGWCSWRDRQRHRNSHHDIQIDLINYFDVKRKK